MRGIFDTSNGRGDLSDMRCMGKLCDFTGIKDEGCGVYFCKGKMDKETRRCGGVGGRANRVHSLSSLNDYTSI